MEEKKEILKKQPHSQLFLRNQVPQNQLNQMGESPKQRKPQNYKTTKIK